MPILNCRSATLKAVSRLVPDITYVMCGARGETNSAFHAALPQSRFIGFEPERCEYLRLTRECRSGVQYVNAAAGGRDEVRTFYVTRNPLCASLLRPNVSLYSRFRSCKEAVEIVGEEKIEVVSLDSFLPSIGVTRIDCLDLDTQGTELEILKGTEAFLSTGIAAVKCEVEFAPLYQDQPLFADVDNYLRGFGFLLFDLSRTRYRRQRFPYYVLTRGQLVWGDALYLRDYTKIPPASKVSYFILSLVAAHFQFHDYALEILEFLLAGGAGELDSGEQTAVAEGRDHYLADLKASGRWVKAVRKLEASGLRNVIRLAGGMVTRLGDRLRKDRLMTDYNWSD